MWEIINYSRGHSYRWKQTTQTAKETIQMVKVTLSDIYITLVILAFLRPYILLRNLLMMPLQENMQKDHLNN